MVTCRPDISFPIIKFAQYSTNPSEIHLKQLKKYIDIVMQQKIKEYIFGQNNLVTIYHPDPFQNFAKTLTMMTNP